MVLYMNMKQLGKRRNTVDQVPFTYAVVPGSLRELIAETVKLCVSRYIEAMNRGEAVLSNAQIDDMAQIGKIAFGIVYGEKAPDVGKSIETAMLGFQDGLFRVFLGDTELTELDEKLELQDWVNRVLPQMYMLKGVTYGRRQEDEAGVRSAGEDRE